MVRCVNHAYPPLSPVLARFQQQTLSAPIGDSHSRFSAYTRPGFGNPARANRRGSQHSENG